MALGDMHYDCLPQQKSTGGKADPAHSAAHPPTETLEVFERRLQAPLHVEGSSRRHASPPFQKTAEVYGRGLGPQEGVGAGG